MIYYRRVDRLDQRRPCRRPSGETSPIETVFFVSFKVISVRLDTPTRGRGSSHLLPNMELYVLLHFQLGGKTASSRLVFLSSSSSPLLALYSLPFLLCLLSSPHLNVSSSSSPLLLLSPPLSSSSSPLSALWVTPPFINSV